MARKHNLKRTRVRQAVEQIVVRPASEDRRVVTGADGSFVVVKGAPAVVKQGRAQGSTTKRGNVRPIATAAKKQAAK